MYVNKLYHVQRWDATRQEWVQHVAKDFDSSRDAINAASQAAYNGGVRCRVVEISERLCREFQPEDSPVIV